MIIPTRNRASILALSLPLMLAQKGDGARDAQIIVVDDASDDGTVEVVRALRSPRITLLRNEKRSGAAAARNRALAVADAEVVVFLDDDAFVGPDFIARHLQVHGRAQRLLAAGGIVEVREPKAGASHLATSAGFHRHPMPGGNSSVRLEHVLAAGGFDEDFDAYGWQDQELAERLLDRGLRRRFVRGAAIFHYKPAAVVLDARHELERERERGTMGARFYFRRPTTAVGITTKLWPPVQKLERMLDRLFSLSERSRRILAGERVMERFSGPWAVMLRSHVEIDAGRIELARLGSSLSRGHPSNTPRST
ncbi:MAG: glycosyltransferase family 2 protein [Gemmatimonadota bacterium]